MEISIVGRITLDRKATWSYGTRERPNAKDTLNLTFPLGEYKKFTQAQDRNIKRSAIESISGQLANAGAGWITLGERVCLIDLDEMKNYFKTLSGTLGKELDALPWPWLTGRVELEPEIKLDEVEATAHFDGYYSSTLELELTEERLTRRPDIIKLVTDKDLAAALVSRLDEYERLMEVDAYLSAIILLGSVLEGLLYSKVDQNRATSGRATSAPKDRTGKVKPFEEWMLDDFIKVTHECGWISKDIRDFSAAIRDYRNMVHPRKQSSQHFHPDAGTCHISYEVVQAVIEDLSK